MYISVYKKVFNVLASTPPTLTPDASNLGEIVSGSGNSLWQCKSQTEGELVSSWDVVSVATPVAPTRTPLASDVGSNVTAADGSIWTVVQSGSSQQLQWTDTGEKVAFEPLECDAVGQLCQVLGEESYACQGVLDGGVVKYAIIECAYVTVYTFAWQLVQPRKTCSACPPITSTQDGDQCYCSNNDSVYEFTYSNTQVTTYYWQKVQEATELALSIADIIKHVSGSMTRKVIDFDEGSFKGYLETDIDDPFMYSLHENTGKIIYSGFIKNWHPNEETHEVEFDNLDLRSIFDTQVIIDYSHDETFDSSLSSIFNKVAEALSEGSGNVNYDFLIPEDLRPTVEVDNYSDQYIIVNAKEFLKVYLLYYGYYISANLDPNTLTIHTIFNEATEDILEIKLNDFKFEKSKNNNQANHTIATIKFQTVYDVDSEWSAATVTEFNTAAIEDKGTLIANELPLLNGYTKDFVIRLIKNVYFEEITEAEYNALTIKQEANIIANSGVPTPGQIVESRGTSFNGEARYMNGGDAPLIQIDGTPINEILVVNQTLFPQMIAMDNPASIDLVISTLNAYEVGSSCEFDKKINLMWKIQNIYGYQSILIQACDGYIQYSCPVNPPTIAAITSEFNPTDYFYGQGLKVQYLNSEGDACRQYTYVKVSSNDVEYWKKGGTLIVPRPKTLASKHYFLGNDNNIYSESIPDAMKLYPVRTKIVEYETLAKSQIEAIYELLNTRYNENIVIDDLKKPIDLDKDFLQMIKVYDKTGNTKLLPVTEKSFDIKEGITNPKIKLGFKKDLFYEIYNSDQSKGVIK